jgi:uncharacterized membrane protein
MLNEFLAVAVTSMLPIAEVRGGIPLGIMIFKLDPALTIAVSAITNTLVFFPVYFGLELFYERFFIRFGWARLLIERIHKKGKPMLDKYGIIGLAIFVGAPLPFTGAWTGTGIAWLFGLEWKKSFIVIAAGVLMAAAIVSTVLLLGLTGLGIFVKQG